MAGTSPAMTIEEMIMAQNNQKIGWIGMGRMGFSMAERLVKAGWVQRSAGQDARSRRLELTEVGTSLAERVLAGRHAVLIGELEQARGIQARETTERRVAVLRQHGVQCRDHRQIIAGKFRESKRAREYERVCRVEASIAGLVLEIFCGWKGRRDIIIVKRIGINTFENNTIKIMVVIP